MASDLVDSCLVVDDDDLLDFSLDDDHKPPSSSSNPNTHDSDHYSRSNPEFEEDLEWIIDKDSFPALDDFFSDPNKTVTLSVLDNNSSSNSNSNSHSITSCCGGLQVPQKYPARKRSNRRRKGRQCWWWTQAMETQTPTSLPKPVTTGGGVLGRRCQHCLAEKTPQWRAGPMGPKTLCNACGVRYKSGRLVAEYRPANSPTFSVALHSNSHRKIMEMRKKMQGG